MLGLGGSHWGAAGVDVETTPVVGRPTAVFDILEAQADQFAPGVLDREDGPERAFFVNIF
jgi:hypothetical protein